MRYPILLHLILLLRKALTSFIGTCEWKTICKLSSSHGSCPGVAV